MKVFANKHLAFLLLVLLGMTAPAFGLWGQAENSSSSAATVITGKVSPNEPVMIIAKSEDGKRIFGYTSPDANGDYTLRLSTKEARLILYVSGLGVKAQSIPVENKSGVKNITVEVANLNIKEVTVTADKITQKNDTVTYYMPTYTKEEDNTLKDALKRLPGIEVKEDGQLMYNGKWVGELYIEGLNMLDSRYGVAVNNINAKDVAAVQVMERHQKIKMLQGKQSGSAPAINIKLKESAKSTWTSMLSLAGGLPLEWKGEINAMMFARKMQNISFAKSNNTGDNLGRELGVSSRLSSPVRILQPSLPSELSEPLYYDNESYSGSISQLHKTGEDSQISFTINYLSDKYMREDASVSEYYTGEGSELMKIEEENSSVARDRAVVGALSYKLNTHKAYLEERLNVMFLKDNSSASTTKNQSPLTQEFGGNTLSLKNDLRLSWGGYDNFKNLYSKLSFETSDADLGVVGASPLSQAYKGTKFVSENNIPLWSKKIPYSRISFDAEANVKTERNKFSDGSGKENKLTQTVLDVLLNPSFIFGRKKVEITAFVPMGYELFSLSGNALTEGMVHSPVIAPTANLAYKANGRTTFNATYSFVRNLASPEYLAGGEWYSNYRTIVSNPQGVGHSVSRTNMLLLSMEYKNAFSMFFANFNVGASSMNSDSIIDYDYSDGSFTRLSYVPLKNNSYSLSINQAASKGFYWGNTKLYEGITAVMGESPYSVGGQVISSFRRSLSGKFSVGTSPWDRLSVDASANVSASQVRSDALWGDVLVSSNADVVVGVSITKGLFASADAKYYYNNHNNARALFVGCGLEYRYREWLFSLTCDNLADVKSYETTILSGVNTFYHKYKLCGRRILLGFRCRLF